MPKLARKIDKEAESDVFQSVPAPTNISYERAVFFDPGERYTGVAIFDRDPSDNTWDCVDAFTWDIEEGSIDRLMTFLQRQVKMGAFDIVGYEVFRLFNDKAQEQTGSEFLACQIIGMVKWICFANGSEGTRWPKQPVEVTRFLPDHKKPTAGWMKKHKISSEARRRNTKGDHAWDAELQGYYVLHHEKGFTMKRKAPEDD